MFDEHQLTITRIEQGENTPAAPPGDGWEYCDSHLYPVKVGMADISLKPGLYLVCIWKRVFLTKLKDQK